MKQRTVDVELGNLDSDSISIFIKDVYEDMKLDMKQ